MRGEGRGRELNRLNISKDCRIGKLILLIGFAHDFKRHVNPEALLLQTTISFVVLIVLLLLLFLKRSYYSKATKWLLSYFGNKTSSKLFELKRKEKKNTPTEILYTNIINI